MIVGNRYELHDMVAQGAYGMVFRATDTRHNKTVAVKMLSGGAKQDANVVERLVREQQAMQALSGTHAVGAIDLCRAQTGALCLVMEWLEGVDMEHHLGELEAESTPMPPAELLSILQPVLDTLEKAHELGIVHRDIKPANIFLLSENRGVRLLDFGLSRLKSSATLTAVGMVMGSPSYMAPEAWAGNSKAIGRQADLYSVAVIVFRALTGRVPFDTDALVEKMRMVTTGKRPSIRAQRPDLPLVLDAWAERALAIDPNRRFQHASHFMESLEAALAGLPLPKHTLSTPQRGRTSIPPPKTTEEERENAVSAALSRAASLLKRLATSLSRVPSPGERREAKTPEEVELPKPPLIAPAAEPRPPIVPPHAPIANKKTIELGDDDLVEWLLDDSADTEATAEQAGPLDRAPTRLDEKTRAALTPPPPAPPTPIEVKDESYDDDWDEVTLPRAQRIVPEISPDAFPVANRSQLPSFALAEESLEAEPAGAAPGEASEPAAASEAPANADAAASFGKPNPPAPESPAQPAKKASATYKGRATAAKKPSGKKASRRAKDKQGGKDEKGAAQKRGAPKQQTKKTVAKAPSKAQAKRAETRSSKKAAPKKKKR